MQKDLKEFSRQPQMESVQTVLITDASSYKAVVLCRFIRLLYPDLRVVTCDHRVITAWLHTRFSERHYVISALPGQPGYLESIADLVDKEHVDVLIPVNSTEMGPLLHGREHLGSTLAYWGSACNFDILNDKQRLQSLCSGLDIPIPAQYDNIDLVTYPAVVKPAVSSSSRGVRYCRDESELYRVLRKSGVRERSLIQAYIPGEGAGYSVFSREGRVTAACGHRRLAEWPIRGGSSTYRENFYHPDMHKIAASLLAATSWSGFAMFEYKLTPAPVLIEVNPRVWGSIHQPLASGIGLLDALLGPANMEQCATLRTFFSPVIYASLLGYLWHGNIRPLADFISHWRVNRSDTTLRSDPAGWFSFLSRLA